MTKIKSKRSPCKSKRFLRDASGNVSLMFAMASIPFLAMAGLAVDMGRGVKAKSDLQTIADAAALAAAAAPDATSSNTRKQIALKFVDVNKETLNAVALASQTVAVGPNTVDVTLGAKVKGTLTKVLNGGHGGGGAEMGDVVGDMDVMAHSKAAFLKDSYLCLLALNPTDYEAVRFYGNSEFMAAYAPCRQTPTT